MKNEKIDHAFRIKHVDSTTTTSNVGNSHCQIESSSCLLAVSAVQMCQWSLGYGDFVLLYNKSCEIGDPAESIANEHEREWEIAKKKE